MATRVREKAEARKANADKRPHAKLMHLRMSPRKVAIVLDLIRGKGVAQAQAILMHTPRIAAPEILKLLNSAVANAENNLDMDPSTLYVAECFAGQGPTLKRFHYHGRGMAMPILKRTSHVYITLDQVQ